MKEYMFYQTLNFQKRDDVLIINLLGPVDDEAKIAILSDELTDLCTDFISDERTRVIILTGTGDKSFFMEPTSFVPLSEANGQSKSFSLAEPISKIDLPVIAAIRGDAVGQGLELVLACDIRIADTTSRFGLPHIKTGLTPWDGGTQRLPRLVGRGKALEMILTGEIIDVQEAYRIGLVNKVVPPDKLMSITMDLAQEMASKGPIASRYAKEAIYKGMDLTLEQGLRLEGDLYLLLHTTLDRTEGIKAFQEKRTPKFKGR